MFEWLWLIPALPLAGFAVLVSGVPLSRKATGAVGVGSVAASAAIAFLTAVQFMAAPPAGRAITQVLWNWIAVSGFAPRVALYFDPLALVMTLVVTGVGFLIHLYSAAFMARQGTPAGDGYRRFFATMNLFVASMLILVLADNLFLLYLGWEGVGLCSYLLIGFWYKDPANGLAAMKAFTVTRVGDAAMAVALFLLFFSLGTLDIQELSRRALLQWSPGSALTVAAAALLLGGAVGKSAQLPLQTWLPDAMAGPTPVSALIHAATMVTAGVYLIARTHVLFELAPAVQMAVAAIGAATLLLAGFSALAQRDIKRVLAYSTMSQVGYMFLALGVGAWSAGIFHFVTHAFFKALLFLAAGVVIASLHEEHDLFRMGGLRKTMPVTFWTFLAGALALASLPPATAGFSKEAILSGVWASGPAGAWLFAVGVAGVFVTALYTFRMLFLTFFGSRAGGTEDSSAGGDGILPCRARACAMPSCDRRAASSGPTKSECTNVLRHPGDAVPLMAVPMMILAVGCLLGGLLQWPEALGGHPWFGNLMRGVFGETPEGGPAGTEVLLGAVSMAAALLGGLTAYWLYLRRPFAARLLAATPAAAALHRLWFTGWGFDWLYDTLFVRPVLFVARVNKADIVDLPYRGLAAANESMHRLLSRTQTGLVRRYAAGLAVGAAVILLVAILW